MCVTASGVTFIQGTEVLELVRGKKYVTNQWFMMGLSSITTFSTCYVLALNCENPPKASKIPNEQKVGPLTKKRDLKTLP